MQLLRLTKRTINYFLPRSVAAVEHHAFPAHSIPVMEVIIIIILLCHWFITDWLFQKIIIRIIVIKICSFLTLKRESRYLIFLSRDVRTWFTSRTEWSSLLTRCRYKSVFVVSTAPSSFSWTLYASTFTMAPVTLLRDCRR